jgi:DNA replication and repair protein RecF
MHIERLRTYNFRNLQRIEVNLDHHMVLIRGPNAQGKTNILEALYLCATGKSFRRAPSKELIRHGEDEGWVEADFVREEVRHKIRVNLGSNGRGVIVDDRLLRKSSKLLELINVVAFFPDDLRLVKGSPEERRRFLDRAVANQYTEFVDASLSYQKALRSRNALLKKGTSDARLIDVFDEALINYGLVIHRCRQKAIENLRQPVKDIFSSIMGEDSVLRVELKSGIAGEAVDIDADSYQQALKESFEMDRRRGITHRGPHRGDLILLLNGLSAQRFASQGQQRSIVLSLKIAEVCELKERLGCSPILLLDDVSSELDSKRCEMFFALVESLGSQVWVSTTGATQLPISKNVPVLEIEEGVII